MVSFQQQINYKGQFRPLKKQAHVHVHVDLRTYTHIYIECIFYPLLHLKQSMWLAECGMFPACSPSVISASIGCLRWSGDNKINFMLLPAGSSESCNRIIRDECVEKRTTDMFPVFAARPFFSRCRIKKELQAAPNVCTAKSNERRTNPSNNASFH